MRNTFKKFIWNIEHYRFLIVGAYNTAFGYLTFVILYQTLGDKLHYLILVVISHIIAVTNAFISQKHLVFRTNGSVFFEFIRFNITTLGTLLLSLAGMSLLVGQFKTKVLVAQALVTVISVMVSYFAHKNFTFKKHKLSLNQSLSVFEQKSQYSNNNFRDYPSITENQPDSSSKILKSLLIISCILLFAILILFKIEFVSDLIINLYHFISRTYF